MKPSQLGDVQSKIQIILLKVSACLDQAIPVIPIYAFLPRFKPQLPIQRPLFPNGIWSEGIREEQLCVICGTLWHQNGLKCSPGKAKPRETSWILFQLLCSGRRRPFHLQRGERSGQGCWLQSVRHKLTAATSAHQTLYHAGYFAGGDSELLTSFTEEERKLIELTLTQVQPLEGPRWAHTQGPALPYFFAADKPQDLGSSNSESKLQVIKKTSQLSRGFKQLQFATLCLT